MKYFTIKALERLTGIKAHTLRIWEQRHSIIKPSRTMTNLRLYTLDDLKLLLDIALLNKFGLKISEIARLDETSRAEAIATYITDEEKQDYVVNQLIISMYALKVNDFKTILKDSVALWDCNIIVHRVLMPFVEKVELMEQRKYSAEESLIKGLVNATFINAIERLAEGDEFKRSALIFQPKKVEKNVMLHYINFIMKSYGYNVYYIEDVSAPHLQIYIKELLPHLIITAIPWGNTHTIKEYATIVNGNTITPLIVSTATNKLPQETLNSKVKYMHFEEIEKQLLNRDARISA